VFRLVLPSPDFTNVEVSFPSSRVQHLLMTTRYRAPCLTTAFIVWLDTAQHHQLLRLSVMRWDCESAISEASTRAGPHPMA